MPLKVREGSDVPAGGFYFQFCTFVCLFVCLFVVLSHKVLDS